MIFYDYCIVILNNGSNQLKLRKFLAERMGANLASRLALRDGVCLDGCAVAVYLQGSHGAESPE